MGSDAQPVPLAGQQRLRMTCPQRQRLGDLPGWQDARGSVAQGFEHGRRGPEDVEDDARDAQEVLCFDGFVFGR